MLKNLYLCIKKDWVIKRIKNNRFLLISMNDINQVYDVNEEALSILTCCSGKYKFNDIIDQLKVIYEDAEEVIEEYTKEYISQAIERGIVFESEDKIEQDIEVYGSAERVVPTTVSIEITKKCPLNCVHCYAEAGNNSTSIERNKLINLLDEATELGIMNLRLTGGEVFAYPNFMEIIEKYSKNFRNIYLSTSGYLLNEEIVRGLSKYKNVNWRISLDGNEETHNEIRRNRFAYMKAIKAIRLLSSYGLSVNATMTISKVNVDEIQFVVKNAYEAGAATFDYGFVLPIGRAGYEDILSTKEIKIVNEQFRKLREKYMGRITILRKYDVKNMTEESNQMLSCGMGWNQLAISADGTCYPCLSLSVKLGNIYENKLAEIIDKPIIESIKKLKYPNKDICGDCLDLDKCYGCVAHVMSLTKNCVYKEYYNKEMKLYVEQ